MSSPSDGIPENIALLTGPQLFGHLFNYCFFGVLTMQVYMYTLSFPGDSRNLKAFIYSLYIIEFVQIVMASHDAYKVFGGGWGNLDALNDIQWLWFDSPILSGIISSSVQCFFAWRIYILSKSLYLGVFIGLVSLMQGSAGMGVGIMVHVYHLTPSAIQDRTGNGLIVWLGGSALCDTLIAVCMLYFLSRGKQGLASDVLLSRLTRLTIETGTLTASFACLDLILCFTNKDNNLHMAPAIVLSKLYTNSLMMMFNNRTQMRNFRGGVQAGGNRIWVSTVTHSETDTGLVIHGSDSGLDTREMARQEFSLKNFVNAGADVGDQGSDMRKDPCVQDAAV